MLAIAGLAAVGLAAILFSGGESGTPVEPVKRDPLAEERRAVDELRRYVSANPDDHKGIVQRCDAALLKVTDSVLAASLRDTRARASTIVEEADATAAIERAMALIREAITKDGAFERVAQIRAQFSESRTVAGSRPRLVALVDRAEQEYRAAWDAAASKSLLMVTDQAHEILAKGQHPEALRALDRFPSQFREGEWTGKLDEARKKIEAAIAKAPPPTKPIWDDYQEALRLLAEPARESRGAELLRDVFRRCNDAEARQRDKLTGAQLDAIAIHGQYAMAAWAARNNDIAGAVSFLESAYSQGFRDRERFDKDPSFDGVRNDERVREVISKSRNKRLGVNCTLLSADEAREFGLPDDRGGFRVDSFVTDSVGERAGMKVGDVMIEIGGQRVPAVCTKETLVTMINSTKDNVDVPIVVLRDRKNITLQVQWKR